MSKPLRDHAARDAHAEEHSSTGADWLNRLRAAVLGADDGIVSTAGLVIGVASATDNRTAIITAGLAGVAAGAMSMAAGEYVSVSSQRDTEQAALRQERRELAHNPAGEMAELAQMYVDRGLSVPLAEQVAKELTAHDALRAHAEVELGINPGRRGLTLERRHHLDAGLPRRILAAPDRDPHAEWLADRAHLRRRTRRARDHRVVERPTRAGRTAGGPSYGSWSVGALAMVVTYGIGRLVGSAL